MTCRPLLPLLLTLTACVSGCSSDEPVTPSGPDLAVLKDEQFESDDALLNGKLVDNEGCVAVRMDGTEDLVAVLWPADSVVVVDDDAWALDSSALETQTRRDVAVSLSGGYREASEAPAASIPDGCTSTSYWVAVSPDL